MLSRRVLQRCAIAISIFSVFYNAAEGTLSIVFGAESASHALVFYGLQSAVEVISDLLVTWRFLSVDESCNELEGSSKSPPKIIRIERIATATIGVMLISLTFAAIGTSAASLAARDHPTTTLPALVIASTSTGVMLLLYLAKRYLARALDSSALHGEALCTLCCMQLSVVVVVASLIYLIWKGGWWLDAAAAIAISLLFGWQGIKAVRWTRSKDFDGGCCAGCHSKDAAKPTAPVPPETSDTEKPGDTKSVPSPCCSSDGCCGSSKKTEVEEASGEQV